MGSRYVPPALRDTSTSIISGDQESTACSKNPEVPNINEMEPKNEAMDDAAPPTRSLAELAVSSEDNAGNAAAEKAEGSSNAENMKMPPTNDRQGRTLYTIDEVHQHFQKPSHGNENAAFDVRPNSTLNNSIAEPNGVGYVVLFPGANPKWDSEKLIYVKSNIDLLPGYKSEPMKKKQLDEANMRANQQEQGHVTFSDKAEGKENSPSLEASEVPLPESPAPAAASDDLPDIIPGQDDSSFKFNPVEPLVVSGERKGKPITEPIPIYAQMGRWNRSFVFVGHYRILDIEFLAPRSPALVLMMDAKWGAMDANRRGKRPAEAWRQSLDVWWAVVKFVEEEGVDIETPAAEGEHAKGKNNEEAKVIVDVKEAAVDKEDGSSSGGVALSTNSVAVQSDTTLADNLPPPPTKQRLPAPPIQIQPELDEPFVQGQRHRPSWGSQRGNSNRGGTFNNRGGSSHDSNNDRASQPHWFGRRGNRGGRGSGNVRRGRRGRPAAIDNPHDHRNYDLRFQLAAQEAEAEEAKRVAREKGEYPNPEGESALDIEWGFMTELKYHIRW
ncbi:MAG: hypothetical protein M1831_006132 [Alyxoria varia]|nr:MAG: hypothetical protein M1831_006132 [Alyxoria varia]